MLLDNGHTAGFLGSQPRSFLKGRDHIGLSEEGRDPLFLLLSPTASDTERENRDLTSLKEQLTLVTILAAKIT